MWPIWLPGFGTPDPGVAEPGSTNPATPDLQEGPRSFSDDTAGSPFAADDSASPDDGWAGGDGTGGGGGGHIGGGGGGGGDGGGGGGGVGVGEGGGGGGFWSSIWELFQ